MSAKNEPVTGTDGLRMGVFDTLSDLAHLSESIALECKLAAGADGRGQLPKDFWSTYSAFANTHGGLIVLGLRETAGRFSVHGVDSADRVVTDLSTRLARCRTEAKPGGLFRTL
jgi:ATP-dependent DNA helicase RecG